MSETTNYFVVGPELTHQEVIELYSKTKQELDQAKDKLKKYRSIALKLASLLPIGPDEDWAIESEIWKVFGEYLKLEREVDEIEWKGE
jgi:hypothetical protein